MMNDKRAALVCVPVCASHARDLPVAIEQAARVADIIELRLDCLEDEALLAAFRETLFQSVENPQRAAQHKPLILTFRPREQGGRCDINGAERARFWRAMAEFINLDTSSTNEKNLPSAETSDENQETLVDVELDLLVGSHAQTSFMRDWDWKRVIVSHHDFKGVPDDLEAIYETMAQTPARIIKLAVRANDIADCLPVLSLLERARRDGRELIAVAMGDSGLLTRILSPSRGAFLTYGALDETQATAPGQISAEDLRRLYRIESIGEETFITGLVGSPVSHSLSPHMHNAAFAAHSLDGVFIPFEVKDLGAFMHRMAHPRTRELKWNLRGLSVTAPHKTEVLKYLDEIDPMAREIGAVNTVVIRGDKLVGYNTDALAALVPLHALLELNGARVAVIGAGGAARALLWGLRQNKARATIFVRDAERARATAGEFGAHVSTLEGASFESFDVVINATPLGTRGANEKLTAASAEALRGVRVVYDLVYNPSETQLLREARAAGCETVSGLQMLAGQATEQFKLWTGIEISPQVMLSTAARVLEARNS